jgi:2-polyprenyl-6-methoxyphenol hydroxylase-like FAD-dependent oxidoreductase
MEVVIAGAGIAGLSAALFLHSRGLRARVFEAVSEIREVGVGINIQPHAIRELARIDLYDSVLQAGNSCLKWAMFNKFGQPIWHEPRGIAAGHEWPQISIHRGRLQGILLNAVKERLGADAVVTGHRTTGFAQDGSKVEIKFENSRAGETVTVRADALIGADGIHSAVRRQLYPNEGAPIFSGGLMWRGVTRTLPFFNNDTQAFAGYANQKFIVYPITRPDAEGLSLINWIADIQADKILRREDWNRLGNLDDFLPLYETWRFPWLDFPALVRGANEVFEYPRVDRNPLQRWSFGRVTLMGDAAHPMFPIGANGGSQAIRDGSAIADALSTHSDPEEAFCAYERERRDVTNKIVVSNRGLGPEQVMQIVEDRAPDGFDNIEDVISRRELEEVSTRYRAVTWADGRN